MAKVKAKLIDVSYAQGVIDWEKVKPHIDGAIIRCGYGMDIAKQDDSQFKRNADECTRLGIPFGVYIYSYADTVEKAKSEATHVLRLIKGYKLSYPVYLDLEEYNTRNGAIERANVFGDIIENAGYMCGVYANLNWWNNYLKGLDRFTKWVAQWGEKCTYTGGNLDMWQYSEKGRISGINGNVDLDYCYRDFPAEINPQPEEDTANKGGSFSVALRTLRFGDKGDDVKALQILLLGNGFPCGKWGADGVFGIATENAVKEYQRKNGMEADGVAGPITGGKLLGVS